MEIPVEVPIEFIEKKFPVGTNNIGEFLGLVTGLVYCKTNTIDLPIYTDSITAISRVEKQKCNSGFFTSTKAQRLQGMVKKAEDILSRNTFTTRILKWDTKKWGEIPSDYGRKQCYTYVIPIKKKGL